MYKSDSGKTILAVIAEFLLLVVIVAIVPFVVLIDTTILSDAMSEDSLTEFLHNCLLGLSIVMFGKGAIKFNVARGYLIAVTTFFSCAFIREFDGVLNGVWHGFWIVPALAVFAVGVVLVVLNRGTLVSPLLRHFETRSATFVYIGILLLLVFTRLFGTGSLWEEIMQDDYSPEYKAAIQEGLELMSYVLIGYGSVTSYLSRFAVKDQ